MDGTSDRRNKPSESNERLRATVKRTDASHSRSNVPVLFRLKNLQRSNAGIDATENDATISPAHENGLATPALANSNVASNTSVRSDSPNSVPAPKTSTDPSTSQTKRSLPTGYILLLVAVIAAYSVGRTSNNANQVGTNNPLAELTANTTETPSTPSVVSIELIAPLAPPALPQMAMGDDADRLLNVEASPEFEFDSTEIATTSKKSTAPQVIMFDSFDSETEPQSNGLDVPTMLISSKPDRKAGTAKAKTANLGVESIDSNSAIVFGGSPSPDDSETLTFSSDNTFENSPTDNQELSTDRSAANVSNNKQAGVVSTSTPNLDTAQLLQIGAKYQEMRNNYQSQMEALARARQAPSNQVESTPSSAPNMQYASTQSMHSTSPNIASPTQGYGAQQTYAGYGVNPAEVAYGSGQPNPATLPNQSNSNGYVPIGAQLSYPPSVQPMAPAPTATTYQPAPSYQPVPPQQSYQPAPPQQSYQSAPGQQPYQPIMTGPNGHPSQASNANMTQPSPAPQSQNFSKPY
ncbi:MAG: hypothetical protein SGI77_26395 [Pirellulaceae bacterium]|nr:hypothetical protein [Pirellulaceae bacterium]